MKICIKVFLAIVLVSICAGALGWYVRDQASPHVYVSGSGERYIHVDDVTGIQTSCDRLRQDWPDNAKLVAVYVGSESSARNACHPPGGRR